MYNTGRASGKAKIRSTNLKWTDVPIQPVNQDKTRMLPSTGNLNLSQSFHAGKAQLEQSWFLNSMSITQEFMPRSAFRGSVPVLF